MGIIYLIGGGPGAGKSSVARALSKRYDLPYWRGDDFSGAHQQEAAERKYPVNNYIDSLHSDEQALEMVKLSARQEMARHEELFFMMLKELRQKQFDRLLLEGNFLLPSLVKERFEWEYDGVWLVPSRDFQRRIYPKRERSTGVLQEDANPPLAMETWIQRDWEFNEEIKRQAEELDLPYLTVDGTKPLKYSEEWAAWQLGLTQNRPD